MAAESWSNPLQDGHVPRAVAPWPHRRIARLQAGLRDHTPLCPGACGKAWWRLFT